MSRSILLVPSVTKGNGSGHIVRCLSLARSLGAGAAVYVPEAKSDGAWSAAELSMAYARELSGISIVSQLPGVARRSPWDLIVLDRRSTRAEELLAWEAFAPVIAVDEGGSAREMAQYLVDILPRHPRAGGGNANRSGIGLLELPLARRKPPREFRRILVSFGGEDSADLSLDLARLLVAEGLALPADLTLVSGALRRGAPPLGLDGVTVLGPVQDLKEHLSRYDLVFTQFGLTAFEAAWAGCGVILLNPTRYHRELSREAGFPEIGVIRPDKKALRRHLRAPAEVLAAVSRLLPEERESLADCMSGLLPVGGRECPSCSSSVRRALYRDPAKSYFRCSACGTVYMQRFSPGRENPYTKGYFFEEYRRQYGKTYLEDWPNLTALAESRLASIEKLAAESLGRTSALSLLDVGCAYGPFLAAAKARGQEPFGLDAAEDAAAYVRRELGIPATAGDFLDPAAASSFGSPFDVISMWYVIEHFERLDKALRNAAAMLRPGGILALSTPSMEGASARFDRQGFFAHSPADHFTIWEPSAARSLLASYGFRVKRIRITGHHPERLPGLRFLASRSRPMPFDRLFRALGSCVSRAFRLGDTFEIYAIREDAGQDANRRQGRPRRASAFPGRDAGSDAKAGRGMIR